MINFRKLAEEEGEPVMGDAINEGYGVSRIQRVPGCAKALATPILEKLQEMPNKDKLLINATLKFVPHIDVVEESEEIAPAACWIAAMLAMDIARRPIVLETMRTRPADDT